MPLVPSKYVLVEDVPLARGVSHGNMALNAQRSCARIRVCSYYPLTVLCLCSPTSFMDKASMHDYDSATDSPYCYTRVFAEGLAHREHAHISQLQC